VGVSVFQKNTGSKEGKLEMWGVMKGGNVVKLGEQFQRGIQAHSKETEPQKGWEVLGKTDTSHNTKTNMGGGGKSGGR